MRGSLRSNLRRARVQRGMGAPTIVNSANAAGGAIMVDSTIDSGDYAGYPTGTVALYQDPMTGDIVGGVDADGNLLQYQDPATGTSGASASSVAADDQPGIVSGAADVVKSLEGAASSTAKAASVMVWGLAGLVLWMVFQESKTPEGRKRFGSQVKDTATGAIHATSSAAKAALL